MSQSGHGNMLVQALRALVITILKIIALLFAWCCKLIGKGFIFISDLTFKLTDK
jgi:hypothetical protein